MTSYEIELLKQLGEVLKRIEVFREQFQEYKDKVDKLERNAKEAAHIHYHYSSPLPIWQPQTPFWTCSTNAAKETNT